MIMDLSIRTATQFPIILFLSIWPGKGSKTYFTSQNFLSQSTYYKLLPCEPRRHIIPTCICMHSHVTWILYESMSHWSPQSYGKSALSFFIYQSHPSIQIHITFCCLLCFVVFYFLFVWMILIMSATWKPHWASRLRWVDDYSIPTTSYVNWQPLYMQQSVLNTPMKFPFVHQWKYFLRNS